MTLARTRQEFLHDLLTWVHIEDTESGFCLRCRYPTQFHPCSVRRRIVDELIRIGHLPAARRTDVLTGRHACCSQTGPWIPACALERSR